MSAPVDAEILVIARPGDAHADAVVELLEERRRVVARTSFNELRAIRIRWSPSGALELDLAPGSFRIGPQTTIWWRRPGWVEVKDLSPDEAELTRAEGVALLEGMLRATGPRWVDAPDVVERAETKLYQLAVARRLGIVVPETLVTNDVAAARRFAAKGAMLAKSVSSGRGAAPFAEPVSYELLALVERAPTLLQRLVNPKTDLRIVTVGDRAFAWRHKGTAGEAVDWRAADPAGKGFRRDAKATKATAAALRVARALDLTMSVQDWLEAGELVFLEVNPQGQWLFLEGAEKEVVESVADHLCSSEHAQDGRWPSAWKRFGWDLLPGRWAPENDGLQPPVFASPRWLVETAANDALALDQARRAHDQADARAAVSEEKASRMLTLCLALLGAGLALAGYQLDLVQDEGLDRWSLVSLVPVAGAVFCFAVAGVHALAVDRVGLYRRPDLGAVADHGDLVRSLVSLEEEARATAQWTAKHKITTLLHARAWLSRGLVALFVAGLVALTSFGYQQARPQQTVAPKDEAAASASRAPQPTPATRRAKPPTVQVSP